MIKRASQAAALALFVAVASGCAAAGTAATTQKQPPAAAESAARRAAEIESLVARAKSSRAEVAADLLIRIAESDLVAEKERKIALLDEAFLRASGSQQPYKRKAWAGAVDTRSGYLANAYDLDLDSLSLRLRVVRAMLPLDKQRARKLFAAAPTIKLQPLGCADALGYDVSAFYETLRQIAQESFVGEETRQGERGRFVEHYVNEITSAAQLGPAVATVHALDLPAPQLASAAHGLAAALKRASGDPRSFYLSLRYGGVARAVEELADECKRKNVASADLLGALRAYLVGNLNSAQCGDTILSPAEEFADGGDIGYVNKWIDDPISPEEIRPARIEDAPQVSPFWTSTEARVLLTKVKSLKFGDGNKPLMPEEKGTLEWQRKLGETVNDVEEWGGAAEKTEEDYFHQKSSLYRALLEVTPEGVARANVVASFVRFLRETGVRQDSHIEWMLHAKYLLTKARAADKGGAQVLETLINSGDATLQLYSDFQRLSP